MEGLKNYFIKSYDELEALNLEARQQNDPKKAQTKYLNFLKKEQGIKAVSVCFSNIEGRLHMLDYDKSFLINSYDNLTFDGSSIRGFSELHESDLRLLIDWTSVTFLPSDLFGGGKVIVFANVANRNLEPYESDFRGLLQSFATKLKKTKDYTAYAAPELEGFLLKDINAEQNYSTQNQFEPVSIGGYYHSKPLDPIRQFIDATADAIRSMGFKNEKDHPEVGPSQFEINFSYCDVVRACDQILLYKLVARQVAESMGMTASFLPKPVQGINGNGMHTNFSLAKGGQNLFYDQSGNEHMSKLAWQFIDRILNRASEICLILNSSVNSYRRLDPNFEAPNQIKVTAIDRGSMIRLPFGNKKSARIEVRSVSPDANPYLLLYTILKTGLEDKSAPNSTNSRVKTLPETIQQSMKLFAKSKYTEQLLGSESKRKYLQYKQAAANRSPSELGESIKQSEIIYHHEVTNQYLWNNF